MKQSNQNKLHMLKEKSIAVKDWIMDNTKIVMPVVLVVCVLITIFVAINANQKEALKKEADAVRQKLPKNAWLCIFTPEGKEMWRQSHP